jgi:hypothetical protein
MAASSNYTGFGVGDVILFRPTPRYASFISASDPRGGDGIDYLRVCVEEVTKDPEEQIRLWPQIEIMRTDGVEKILATTEVQDPKDRILNDKICNFVRTVVFAEQAIPELSRGSFMKGHGAVNLHNGIMITVDSYFDGRVSGLDNSSAERVTAPHPNFFPVILN